MKHSRTVADLIRKHFESLTKKERHFANFLLENYPVSCMGTITKIAHNANVSTPTVMRMVKKIGFDGFSDFQTAVRVEVEDQMSRPITEHNRWSESASDEHILNTFADAIVDNLRQSLMHIDPSMFDAIVEALSNDKKQLFIAGGRITSSLAQYLATHLQVARKNVTLLPASASAWPHYLLDMEKGHILFVFDMRRYEQTLISLVEVARERGVEVVLVTDQWASPAAKFARYVFNLRIEAPSCWDSSVVPLFLIESLIAAVQDKTWKATKKRIDDMEDLFDQTKLFKKFNL